MPRFAYLFIPFLLLATLAGTRAHAKEHWVLNTTETVQSFFNEQLTKIDRAFALANIEVEVKILPGTRALRLSSQGLSDGELLRQADTMRDYPQLVAINFPIKQDNYWIWVNTQQSCPQQADDLATLRPVGVRGDQIFARSYRLSTVGYAEVLTIDDAIGMLGRQRADYITLPQHALKKLAPSLAKHLKRCLTQPLFSLNYFTYIRIEHQEHLPRLERSFRQVFGPDIFLDSLSIHHALLR